MHLTDNRALAGQVGQRARHPAHPVQAASAEPVRAQLVLEQGGGRWREGPDLVEAGGGQLVRMEVGDAIIRSKRGSRIGPMEMRVKVVNGSAGRLAGRPAGISAVARASAFGKCSRGPPSATHTRLIATSEPIRATPYASVHNSAFTSIMNAWTLVAQRATDLQVVIHRLPKCAHDAPPGHGSASRESAARSTLA